MFKHILVPLDGSQLAATVIPYVGMIAEKIDAQVTLLHVIEAKAPSEIHGEKHLTQESEANKYLSNIVQNDFSPSVQVAIHVHTEEVKNVARSIVGHSDELEPDLIMMCTHGRGGVLGFMVGSIAQQVIGMGKTPVLLIPSEIENTQKIPVIGRIMVALDGDPEHAQSLVTAADFAKGLKCSLDLVTVVPTLDTLTAENAATGKFLPATTSAVLDMSVEMVADELVDQANQLRREGLEVRVWVERGDPIQKLIETASRTLADVLVLGTHGKSGMDAFWSGSVAPKLAGRIHVPILYIPVHSDRL